MQATLETLEQDTQGQEAIEEPKLNLNNSFLHLGMKLIDPELEKQYSHTIAIRNSNSDNQTILTELDGFLESYRATVNRYIQLGIMPPMEELIHISLLADHPQANPLHVMKSYMAMIRDNIANANQPISA